MWLPLFSLPSPGPIGGLGPVAHAFVDGLAAAGQSTWQILPPHPTTAGAGNSPYSGLSAFALDPVLVSAELLVEDGLVGSEEGGGGVATGRVDWEGARLRAARLLAAAVAALARSSDGRAELEAFRVRHRAWLEDYALFRALKRRFGGLSWVEWPAPLRGRDEEALEAARRDLGAEIDREIATQVLLDGQWRALRRRADEAGVELLGDLPFYVAHDSADVWSRPQLFSLDADGRPQEVGGCPPDELSADGQLWGQPVYRWARQREEGFSWWLRRIERQLELVDRVRLDHFRGLEATWNVPAGSATAAAGRWVPAPGDELVSALVAGWPRRPFVAEDLGVLTDEVERLRRCLGAPATRVVQFGFGEDYPDGPHLPENAPADCLLYCGTHDNDTLTGWLSGLAGATRDRVESYLNARGTDASALAPRLVERVYASAAAHVIAGCGDALGLGSEGRINRPGAPWGQWEWRLLAADLAPALERLARWTRRSDRRSGPAAPEAG